MIKWLFRDTMTLGSESSFVSLMLRESDCVTSVGKESSISLFLFGFNLDYSIRLGSVTYKYSR